MGENSTSGIDPADEPEGAMSSIDLRRQQLGTVLQRLASDLVEERRRRHRLEREIQELRAALAARETGDSAEGARSGAAAGASEDTGDAIRERARHDQGARRLI
jgi:hypothetical protein